MIKRPLSVNAALGFILLNSLVWLVFGGIAAANANPALPVPPLIKVIMAFLSIAIAGMLLGLFIFIRRRNRIAYYLILGLLVITFLLNFFDNVGLVDLAVIIINLIPIILLIKDRSWYLQGKPQIQGIV
jgi:hypothetical protein